MKYGEFIFEKNYFELPEVGACCTFSQVSKLGKLATFSIMCCKQGMNFKGTLEGEISSKKDLQEFARLVSDAWIEYEKLKPKIYKPGPSGELL